MRNSIIFFQRILPHYRKGFFKMFSAKYPDTTVLFGQPYKGESLQNAKDGFDFNFNKCTHLYLDKNGKIFISGIYRKIIKEKPSIVISVFNIGNLNLYMLLLLRHILKFKLILWSFGYDPKRGFNPAKYFGDRVRLSLSERSDAVIFYWPEGLNEVKKFSKKSGHYFVAPNTLDTKKLFSLKEEFDKQGRDKIRIELGITGNYHFIYVGRLLKDKQADLLIKAFKIVSDKHSNAELSIIGDGPEANSLKKLASDVGLSEIRFHGEITDDEITGKWIFASDAFVMPGRLGLSVVHSFCFGTPVISQDKQSYFHGEGIGYLENGTNGLLAEDGNISELAEKINWFIENPDASMRMRENAFRTAGTECSIENMIEGFSKAIEHVKAKASN